VQQSWGNLVDLIVLKVEHSYVPVHGQNIASKDWESLEDTIAKQAREISERVPPPISSKRNRDERGSPEDSQRKKLWATAVNKPREQGGSSFATVLSGNQPRGEMPVRPKKPKVPKKVRQKADALLIEAKEPQSYADILNKVKKDPTLKELGSLVARVRRTQKGEMLLELKNDPGVKSESYKELLTKSIESLASVRALSQQVVVECLHIDEVTTEAELREALKEIFPIGDLAMSATIRMRKSFSVTQIGSLKLPAAYASELMEQGKMRVGWTICPLRIPDRRLTRC
jgi:hypothetical protein